MIKVKKKDRIAARVSPLDYFPMRFSSDEKKSLAKLAKSENLKDRRLCVDYLGNGVIVVRNSHFLINMLDKLIPDRSHYVRWQSLIMLEELAHAYPEKAWPLIVKWGSVKNRDIRMGVGLCVLEHVLAENFSEIFPKIKSIIESGNRLFAFTFKFCRKMGQAEEPRNATLFDTLQNKFGVKP